MESAAAADLHFLYLNFSNASDTIKLAPYDRARDNLSAILGADPYPSFAWEPFVSEGSTRDEVVLGGSPTQIVAARQYLLSPLERDLSADDRHVDADVGKPGARIA